MAIDVEEDELITLAEAAGSLPKRVGATTLYRWWKKGVLVATAKPDGGEELRRVKLETIRVGGRGRYTTRDAFRRFVEATNPPEADALAEADRDRRNRADAKLSAAGVLPKAADGPAATRSLTTDQAEGTDADLRKAGMFDRRKPRRRSAAAV